MIDLFPDFGDIALWLAGGGGGWFVHKRVTINYKERWKGAVALLKEEKLQTEEIEDVLPKPKEKPRHFAPAGNPDEFKSMTNTERYKSEIARLQNGLPPKDSMIGLTNYHAICIERIKTGWDWDQELNGWGWHQTKTHRELEARHRAEVDKAYKEGEREGFRKTSYLDGYRRNSAAYLEYGRKFKSRY